jgi:hypothetical protein
MMAVLSLKPQQARTFGAPDSQRATGFPQRSGQARASARHEIDPAAAAGERFEHVVVKVDVCRAAQDEIRR